MAQTTTRSPEEVAGQVVAWLDAGLKLVEAVRPEGTGLSSETLLLEVRGRDGSTGRHVLRLPPPSDAFPLFPTYDLARQVAAMRLVRAGSDVPVPRVTAFEPTGDVVGAPFVLMERVDGRAASDMPPYTFGGWVVEAMPRDRAAMTEAMAGVLAAIHGVQPDPALDLTTGGETALQRHVANQRAYYDWIRDGGSYPLVDRAFEWLEARWPAEGEAVLSWGDARLANVLWDGVRPAAVLDWEAAALGPRELDVGWLLYFADYFQRIAEQHGSAGVPDLLRRDDVVAAYERMTGRPLRDLEWFLVYAALRQALTSIRVSSRAVHFGERPAPNDPEEHIMDRDHLAEAVGA